MPLVKPAIFLTLIAAGPTPLLPAFLDGNKLLALCEAADLDSRSVCNTYVQGVVDEWRYARFLNAVDEGKDPHVCAPEAVGNQLADAVVNYLKAHPGDRNKPAAVAVTQSIIEAWHCQP
jgi:hypothetical protein